MHQAHEPEDTSLRHLFPDRNEDEIRRIEEVFYGYLQIVWDIYREAKELHPEPFDETASSA